MTLSTSMVHFDAFTWEKCHKLPIRQQTSFLGVSFFQKVRRFYWISSSHSLWLWRLRFKNGKKHWLNFSDVYWVIATCLQWIQIGTSFPIFGEKRFKHHWNHRPNVEKRRRFPEICNLVNHEAHVLTKGLAFFGIKELMETSMDRGLSNITMSWVPPPNWHHFFLKPLSDPSGLRVLSSNIFGIIIPNMTHTTSKKKLAKVTFLLFSSFSPLFLFPAFWWRWHLLLPLLRFWLRSTASTEH